MDHAGLVCSLECCATDGRGGSWNDEGTIVSSYYGYRYEIHIDPFDRRHRERITRQREERLRAERERQERNDGRGV